MPSEPETDEAVYCCFCSELLSRRNAALVTVAPPAAREETQTVYCHGACLVKGLDPRIPWHTNLRDEALPLAAAPERITRTDAN